MKQKIIFILVIMLSLALFLSGCTDEKTPAGPPSDPKQDESKDTNYNLPPIDTTQPIPENPIEGETKTLELGNLEITYYNKVYSNSLIFLGGDLIIKVKNTGESNETVYSETSGEIPSWNMHFFSFQNNTNTIKPDEAKEYHYFASLDSGGQFDLDFSFWQNQDKSDKVTATISFYCENSRLEFPSTAQIYGGVYDKETNKPIEDAEVVCYYYTGREKAWSERSSEQGNYFLTIPSAEDITSFFGNQDVYYDSLGFFIFVEHDGYEYYYEDGFNLDRGEQYKFDIYLKPLDTKTDYTVDWEEKVEDYYGFFWLNVDDNWNRLFATQAKHPPELVYENGEYYQTNIYMFDVSNGEKLWSYPTNSECWGSDITSNGNYCAAGSHDQTTYLINSDDGTLKWSANSGGMNREVEFSNDNTLLLAGPAESSGTNYDFALYRVADGSIQKGFDYGDWLRNSRFTYDDSEFVVGMGGGQLAMYETSSGDMLWEHFIGEFPLFLEIDDDKNVYATGKGRTLFSYDKNGDIRWSTRIPDHTLTSGTISTDGSYLVLGSVGSWIYYIDSDTGEIIWRTRQAVHSEKVDEEISTVGHNAVSISKDGEYIAVGGGPANHLTVLNTKGTKIFEHTSELNDDSILNDKWASIGAGASEGTQKGIMCTVISENGERIIAGYGDNYVRSFVKN